MDSLRARDNGPADQIGQAHLPLFFGLGDAVQFVSGRNSSLQASNPTIDVVHNLAFEVLHTPLFTAMEWTSSDNQPTKVFHLACRILEGKAPSSSLIVAQATANLLTTKDPEESARSGRGLRRRPLRLSTHTTWMARSQPPLIIHEPPQAQFIFPM